MPKEIYTERDIEDLVKRGVTSLDITDDVVLTDLAWEKAKKLGLKLVLQDELHPTLPVRPYLNKPIQEIKVAKKPSNQTDEVKEKVRQAVIERLGTEVDPVMLDKMIDRVIKNHRNL